MVIRGRRWKSCGQLGTMVAVLVVLLAGTAGIVEAQSSNGQITGLVTDATGAAIADATITATNAATGVTYTNTSNGSGVYFLPQLVPGPYTVSLTKEGFATTRRTDLTVHTGDRLSLDFTLKVASRRR